MRRFRIGQTGCKFSISPAEPIAAPPTQSSVGGPSAPQIILILRKEKRTIQVSDTSDSDTSSVRISNRQLEKQNKASDSQYFVQIIQNTEGCLTEIPISDTTFIGVASPRNPNERWTASPFLNLPCDMTVLEAEERSDNSESTFKNSFNSVFYFM